VVIQRWKLGGIDDEKRRGQGMAGVIREEDVGGDVVAVLGRW
jgi:hypothetical protein